MQAIAAKTLLSELLPLFLFLGGMPQGPTGQPAGAAEVLRYVPAKAQMVATVDLGSVLPAALAGFRAMENEPFLKDDERLQRDYKKFQQELDRGLKMASAMMQIDPTKDLRYATFSVVFGKEKEKPLWMASVGGNLRLEFAEQLASMMRTEDDQPLGQGHFYEAKSERKPSLGFTDDGVLLAGSAKLVKAALKKKRKKPSSIVKLMTSQYDDKSIATAGFHPNAIRKLAVKAEKALPIAKQVNGLYAAMRYSGSRLVIRGKSKKSTSQFRQVLDGWGLMMTGTELLLRGGLEIGQAVIAGKPNKKVPAPLRIMTKHRKTLLRYITRHLPAKPPTHSVSVQPRQRLITLDYQGSSLLGSIPLLISGSGYFILL
jgi:hypothetical protein